MTNEEEIEKLREKLNNCNSLQLYVLLFYYTFQLLFIVIGNIFTAIATGVGAIYFYLTSLSLVKDGKYFTGVLLLILTLAVVMNLYRLVTRIGRCK